jgi:hypothetical protein
MKSNIFELTAGTRVISLSSRLVLALIPDTKGIYSNLQGQLPIFRVHPIYGRQDWKGVCWVCMVMSYF